MSFGCHVFVVAPNDEHRVHSWVILCSSLTRFFLLRFRIAHTQTHHKQRCRRSSIGRCMSRMTDVGDRVMHIARTYRQLWCFVSLLCASEPCECGCVHWLATRFFVWTTSKNPAPHRIHTHTHMHMHFLWLVTSEFNVCTRKPVLAAKQRSEETRRLAGALNFKCSCTTVIVVQWGNSTAVMSSRRTKFSAPSKYCLVWTVSVRRRLTMHIYLYVQTCIFWVINVLPLARLSSYFPIIPPHLSFWAPGARGCLGRSCHIFPVRRFLHHISQHWRWHTGYIRLWRMLCFGELGWSCHSAHDRKSSRGAYETLPLCWNADPRHSSRSVRPSTWGDVRE